MAFTFGLRPISFSEPTRPWRVDCPPKAAKTVLTAVRILGLVCRTHDSGLALVEHGIPTLVLEEERFNREKHTRKFPFGSLKAAFDNRRLDLSAVDVIICHGT
jgi:hypothetical protein